ncbi:MAG: pyridoxamine 5'-phosphate oxidase family protein [Actinomycetia bacterium]|nr:pyridoxamine 5'-phosphate oxidase family protein [Actinomycetes bacterium]
MSFEISSNATPGSSDPFNVASRQQAASIDELAPEYRQLIDRPYTVTLATVARNGRAQLSPMRFRASQDRRRVELNTVIGRIKDHQMRRHPRISIQTTNPENPYHWLSMYGEVVDVIRESDPERGHLATESVDSLAELYLGERPYSFWTNGEERVLHIAAPTQIVTFGTPG